MAKTSRSRLRRGMTKEEKGEIKIWGYEGNVTMAFEILARKGLELWGKGIL